MLCAELKNKYNHLMKIEKRSSNQNFSMSIGGQYQLHGRNGMAETRHTF